MPSVAPTSIPAPSGDFTPGPRQQAERPGAEYASELYYGFHLSKWIILHPNVQYIINPGGFDHNKDIVVIGLKANIVL
uniref:carbohydrate porin n=1 Tax=Pedomonas mirosovicensis TaxID=2908641 RepID=UPI0035BC4DFB